VAPAQHLRVDAGDVPDRPLPQLCVVKGDSTSASIMAASIVAKVYRDRLMIEYDRQYPGYGFAGHKGYATPSHKRALRELGPSPIHRMSWAPIRAVLGNVSLAETIVSAVEVPDGEPSPARRTPASP